MSLAAAASPVVSRSPESFQASITARTAKIGVVGLGYVGLPLTLLFSGEKFVVTGFDIDARKVQTLTQGGSYFARIDPEMVQAARKQGFRPTTDYSHISEMDAVIICVPTPLDEFRQPDMSYITGTAKSIAPHLRAGQLIVLESTTYPGTTEEVLIPILEKGNPLGLKAARAGEKNGNVFY